MRSTMMATAVAVAIAAQPACAEGVSAGGIATAGAAAAAAAVAEGTREARTPPSYTQAADDRLLPPSAPLIAPDPANLPVARLRPAFGNSMTSFYPFAREGFHFSAGGKLYGRMAAAPADVPDRMRFLLGSAPRSSGARATRKFAPAALFGFDRSLARKLVFGVDGGLVMGRLSPAAYQVGRGPSLRAAGSYSATQAANNRGEANGIARMTLSYRF